MIRGVSTSLFRMTNVAPRRCLSTLLSLPIHGFHITFGDSSPSFMELNCFESSDGPSLHPHLVMQDLVAGRLNPSIIDIKIGSRTWYPQASEDYVQKCLKKDKETTSLLLGFRISGLQIYGNNESGFWKPEESLVQAFTPDDVRLVLQKFVSSNSPSDSNAVPDYSFAPSVYGGSDGILAQLLELKAWFEDQTIYHFNSCSILMLYEKESMMKGRSSGAEIKLTDFAHVVEGKGVIDHNLLGGLCSFVKFVSEILTSSDEHSTESCSPDSEKRCISTDNGTTE